VTRHSLVPAPESQLNKALSQSLRQVQRSVLSPLFWTWLKAAAQDRRDWMYPTGTPEVRIAGTNPARILIIGDDTVAGFGVRTHQLGIAGHLARYLYESLARGVVVTVAAQPGASARSTLKRLGDLDVGGFDAIVLMLATTDAFCLTPRRSWRRDMTSLVSFLKSADASSMFVTSAASLQSARPLSPFARRLTGRHACLLNVETRRICSLTGTSLISLDAASDLTSRIYARWARRIGSCVTESLRREPGNGLSINTDVSSRAPCRPTRRTPT
jgi:hypothetical protein